MISTEKCSVTDIDKNASNADWWSNDTHLSYTCNSGYTLNSGNLQRTCLNDGTWSGTLPTCTSKNIIYISVYLISINFAIQQNRLEFSKHSDFKNKTYINGREWLRVH